jgi:hypothetical protein
MGHAAHRAMGQQCTIPAPLDSLAAGSLYTVLCLSTGSLSTVLCLILMPEVPCCQVLLCITVGLTALVSCCCVLSCLPACPPIVVPEHQCWSCGVVLHTVLPRHHPAGRGAVLPPALHTQDGVHLGSFRAHPHRTEQVGCVIHPCAQHVGHHSMHTHGRAPPHTRAHTYTYTHTHTHTYTHVQARSCARTHRRRRTDRQTDRQR